MKVMRKVTFGALILLATTYFVTLRYLFLPDEPSEQLQPVPSAGTLVTFSVQEVTETTVQGDTSSDWPFYGESHYPGLGLPAVSTPLPFQNKMFCSTNRGMCLDIGSIMQRPASHQKSVIQDLFDRQGFKTVQVERNVVIPLQLYFSEYGQKPVFNSFRLSLTYTINQDLVSTAGQKLGIEGFEVGSIVKSVETWVGVASQRRTYSEPVTTVQLVNPTIAITIEIRIFDQMIGLRMVTSDDALVDNVQLSTDFKFGDTSSDRSIMLLNFGDENGHQIKSFSELSKAKIHLSGHSFPASFRYSEYDCSKSNRKSCEFTMSVSAACNMVTSDPKFNIDYGTYQINVEKIAPTFGENQPFIVWQFAKDFDSLASRGESLGLFCRKPEPLDYSWVKPGKTFRARMRTTPEMKEYMQFISETKCASHIMVDAEWYGNEYDKSSDPMRPKNIERDTNKRQKAMDLAAISSYGDSLSPPVGSFYYINDVALKGSGLVDEMARRLAKSGVKGVKLGFVACSSAGDIQRVVHYIQIFGKHKLMVNVHDNYRSYGLERTFPFLVSVEAVRGEEHQSDDTKSCGKELFQAGKCFSRTTREMNILPFARMLGGRMDYTFFGDAMDPARSVMYQVAATVILTNGQTHVHFNDKIAVVNKLHQGATRGNSFNLFRVTPEYYVESKYLQSEPGEFVSVARRGNDGVWVVAAMTAQCKEDQTRRIRFNWVYDFLDENVNYIADEWCQDNMPSAEDVGEKHDIPVVRGDMRSVSLYPARGCLIRFKPQ